MLLKFFSEISRLFDAEDRRQWPVLLGASLVSGLSRSLILAAINAAIAAYGRGQPSLQYLWAVLVLAVLALGMGYFSAVRGELVAARMGIRLRNRLLARLRASNLRMVERIGPDHLHWHIMHTVQTLASTYGTFLAFVGSVVMLLFNFVYIGWLSAWGLLMAVIITVVGVAVHFRQERLNMEPKRILDALNNESSAQHREFLRGYKELRLAEAKADDHQATIDAINQRIRSEGLRSSRISAKGNLVTYFFQLLMMLAVAFILTGVANLEAVTVMQLLTAILFTVAPLEAAVSAFPGFVHARVALNNLHRIESEIAAAGDDDQAVSPAAALPAFEAIELRGVEFRFGNAEDEDAFHLGPVDLGIRRGEVVFIAGGNGSGKTVLMRLLTGLYRPTAGTILYNGRALEPGQRQAYREQFSTVFNDFHLFRRLLGHDEVSPDAVTRLVRMLALEGKTAYTDGGFSTVALSTGQRKRLAYLVALLDDRAVYVLDEFGAEQDPGSRQRFYDEWVPALKAAGKTVLVVTHDDAYFDRCDRLIKMDLGRVVTHRSAAEPKVPA